MSSMNVSQLPVDVQLIQVAVPGSATAVTGVAATAIVDVFRISVTNTDAGALNFTLTDAADIPLAGIDAVVLSPSDEPLDLEFRQPIRCVGLKWFGSSTGLIANLFARRNTVWTQTGGYASGTGSV